MSQIDIVARLQLKAEQFSSETGQRFAEMKTRAQSTAQEIKSSFTGAFAEVQKLSAQALTSPRTTGGSLDLSGEIATLRAASIEADQHAQALRELSIAQTRVAESGRGDAQALKLEADAAAVGALAAERHATATRDRIAALEQVQLELNQTASATDRSVAAGARAIVSAGQQRASTMMLGQQVQDFAVQVVSGQSVVTAFTQQIGQAAFAVQGMGGKMAGVASFLGSGWGAAVLVAVTVLTPLIAKLVETNHALEDAVDKLKDQAKQSEITAQARAIYARSEEAVTAATREGVEATRKSIEAEKSAAEQSNIAAKNNLRDELAIRRKTQAQLEYARALLDAERTRSMQGGERGDVAAQGVARYQGDVDALTNKLSRNSILIAEAEGRVQETRIDLAAEAAKRAIDPIARINRLYDERVNATKAQARAEGIVTAELTRRLAVIERNRRSAVETEQERQREADRKKPTPSLGSQLRAEQGQRLLSASQGYNGASERTTAGKASLRELFSGAGISIDPEKVAWCAAFVNAVLAGQGIKGTGSLSARSFLGYGTATDHPVQGDIVVLKRGNDQTQGHVGFYAGEKNGRVQVTGGNQGDAVSTTSFARSDVLGFRRAPTASAEFKTNAKDAAREVKELDRALEEVTKQFDPAASAAAEFTELFAKIGDLKEAGRITAEQADMLTFKAIVQEAEQRRNAQFAEWKKALGEAGDPFAGVSTYDQGLASKWDKATADVADRAQRQAENNIRDLSDLYYDLFDSRSGNIWDNFRSRAASVLADVAAKETIGLLTGGREDGAANDGGAGEDAVRELRQINTGVAKLPFGISKETAKTVIQGAGIGTVGGSVFASITGGKNSTVASAVGGVLGDVAGKAIGKSIGAGASGLLKSLGGAAGPLGAIAGGILGNVVGGLFKKTTQASSTITFGAQGLEAGTAVGNGAAERAAASASAKSVVGSLNRIAEAVGGVVTGAGSVSIGYRPGHKDPAYRVDTTGQGRLTGVLAFATEEEAIRAAIADALKDGVIGGISDASKRILAAGGDLEKALTKASLIEAIPRDLKAMLDPVGAAIDDLNRKWKQTVEALNEGGASAEQMTQAQRLYDLQLAQVKNSTASASASLKDFLNDMKLGSNSPLSLRDQEAAALTQLKPFLDQIQGGQAVDQSKYQQAAKTYLDVQRELYGSTAKFFEAFDAVQATTAKAIATIDNAAPITAAVESPFAKATATSAASTASNTQTANEIAAEQTDVLIQVRNLLSQMASSGGTDASFIGTGRLFQAQQAL